MTIKWTDITRFNNLRRGYQLREERVQIPQPTLSFRGKVKLDGTNAAVRVDPRFVEGPGYHAQSRSRDIGLSDDNMGFAAWVELNRNYFLRLRDAAGKTVVIFGEWCGKGIQKRCSISKIDRKVFAVFAIEAHFPEGEDTKTRILVDPDLIRSHLPDHPDIYVIPWAEGEDVTVDFADTESLDAAALIFNERIDEVETCDPWVKATFDVDGLGEGLVYYPLLPGVIGSSAVRDDVTSAMFKAKGEKHEVKKRKKAVEVDTEVVASVEAFVEMFVTDNRCEQAVTTACNGEYDRVFTGNFLQWVGGDIKKESGDELEAAGLTWKQVGKGVQKAARTWFFARA